MYIKATGCAPAKGAKEQGMFLPNLAEVLAGGAVEGPPDSLA
jgi:hypothetical protein